MTDLRTHRGDASPTGLACADPRGEGKLPRTDPAEKRFRIVHVITCLLGAGAEENTIITCNAQAADGHEVHLLFGCEFDRDTLATVDHNVRTVRVGSLRRQIAPRQDASALRRLTREIRSIRPDVVHTHNSKAGILGRLAARWAGVPVILHGVHILPFVKVSLAKKYLYLALERAVAPFTDAFISVSRGMRDANLAAGLGTRANNYVVYSGMDLAPFREAIPADRPEGAGRLIALVASLEPRKRHLEFLEVFRRLRQDYPDVHLVLLGQGPLEDELRDRAARMGLESAVHFLGFRTDVNRWLAAADICVLPSIREGLPRVVVQYVAAGCPVVVTKVPGLEEIVADGETGFIVASGKVADMKDPIDRLLSEPELLASMAAAARRRDVSRWSMERMAPEIDRIMRHIVAEKGARSPETFAAD